MPGDKCMVLRCPLQRRAIYAESIHSKPSGDTEKPPAHGFKDHIRIVDVIYTAFISKVERKVFALQISCLGFGVSLSK